MSEITRGLAGALRRIDDFKAVQAGTDADELQAAATLLQESVGIGDGERVVLREWLERAGGTKRADGHVLLGIIVGLMAGEEG